MSFLSFLNAFGENAVIAVRSLSSSLVRQVKSSQEKKSSGPRMVETGNGEEKREGDGIGSWRRKEERGKRTERGEIIAVYNNILQCEKEEILTGKERETRQKTEGEKCIAE